MNRKQASSRIIVSSLVTLAIGAPTAGLADDNTYQAEGGLSYTRASFVGGHYDFFSGQATYFFDKLPASPKDYPLEQAPFVERIGSVSAGYGQLSQKLDYATELSKGSMYNIGVNFARPNNPLIAWANYSSYNSGKFRDSSVNMEFESDSNYYDLAIGAYAGKTTAVVLRWSKDNTKSKTTSNSGVIDRKSTYTTTGFAANHLQRLSDDTHIAFTAGISRTDTDNYGNSPSYKSNGINLGGTYYPAKRLGLSVGIGIDRGDGAVGSQDEDTYFAGVRTYITPKISLGLNYSHFKTAIKSTSSSSYDYNSHYISLGASMRF